MAIVYCYHAYLQYEDGFMEPEGTVTTENPYLEKGDKVYIPKEKDYSYVKYVDKEFSKVICVRTRRELK